MRYRLTNSWFSGEFAMASSGYSWIARCRAALDPEVGEDVAVESGALGGVLGDAGSGADFGTGPKPLREK